MNFVIDQRQTRTRSEDLTGIIKMDVDVKELARGRWPWILSGLGIDSKFLTKKNGPCPMCGGKDRFRFTDFQGEGRYYCAQCGPGDGFDLSGKVTGKKFPEIRDYIIQVAGKVKPMIQHLDYEECYKEQAKVWGNGRKPPIDGPVQRYLIQRLGQFPEDLKNIRQFEGNMIARVTNEKDMGVNIHRTFLVADQNGGVKRTDRKMMKGAIPKGSAIRLRQAKNGILGIAEGVETALSATLLFGVPCWSVISTSGMLNWIPPEDVETVVVYGDNDANYAGQAAAYGIANKLSTQWGKKVEVRIPPITGWDWNDALKARG